MNCQLSYKVKKRKFKDLGYGFKNERAFFDFYISGAPLLEILKNLFSKFDRNTGLGKPKI